MATPAPFKLTDPSFILDPDTLAVELKCSSRQITHTVDYETTDDSTFCEPSAEGIGKVTETIELTVLQSFGTDGLWNLLSPLALTVVDFQLFTVAGIWAEDSPVMTGTCMVPPVPLVDAEVGANTEMTLVFRIRSGGYASIVTTEPV
jgi:hypothetical protein